MGSGTYLFGSTRVLVRLGGYLPGSGLYPFCFLPVLGSGILGARPRVGGLLPGSVVLPLVPGHCFFHAFATLLYFCLAALLLFFPELGALAWPRLGSGPCAGSSVLPLGSQYLPIGSVAGCPWSFPPVGTC